jgi:hypothetical protein
MTRGLRFAAFFIFFGSVIFALRLSGEQVQTHDKDDVPVPRDPALQSLLDKAGKYAKSYRELCRELVAEERMIQKEYDKKGRLKNQRSFISDYLIVTLPSAPQATVEFRDLLSIDGKPLPRRQEGLLELFREKSSNAFKEAERVTKESTKHNLGRKRYTNMVNFGLNFLLPENQAKIEYEFQNPGKSSPDATSVVIRFHESSEKTALHAVTPFGVRPIVSNGYIWLSLPDVRILRIDFSFKEENEYYPIAGRYISEYSPGPDNLLLPKRFEERFYDVENPEVLLFESEAEYLNFRRFSVEVKIVPDE